MVHGQVDCFDDVIQADEFIRWVEFADDAEAAG